MSEIDAMLAGFSGGFFGAILVFGVGFYYLRSVTAQYQRVKDDFKDIVIAKDLIEEVRMLRKDVNLLLGNTK